MKLATVCCRPFWRINLNYYSNDIDHCLAFPDRIQSGEGITLPYVPVNS